MEDREEVIMIITEIRRIAKEIGRHTHPSATKSDFICVSKDPMWRIYLMFQMDDEGTRIHCGYRFNKKEWGEERKIDSKETISIADPKCFDRIEAIIENGGWHEN